MKRKIFTLFLGCMAVVVVFAQQPSAEILKATTAPEIDGVIDEVWATASPNNIDQPFQAELPTLGESGETTWKALWTEDGWYILLQVTDDGFWPNYAVTPAGNNWEYDKPEIYFDVNYELADGLGPAAGLGHFQVAPGFTDGKNDGTPFTGTDGVVYAFMVSDPYTGYIGEYFIPWAKLVDKDGIQIDLTANVGFDVTIIDREDGDPGRKRAVWANVGAINESWSNMNDCGIITFLGAAAATDVESIEITGGTITVNNGTLQIVATVLPENATNKALKWTVQNGTGRATISSSGVVTPIMNGEVTVMASSTDGSFIDATATVTISNQFVSLEEINVIKNGDFNEVSATLQGIGWGGWTDAAPGHTVAEGVSVHTPLTTADVWRYQFNQENLNALPNVDYQFKFKAWAAAERTFNVDFEDIAGNNYNRYGATTDPRSGNGRCDWTFNITTEPTWYIFDVNFDQIVGNTVQKVQFMLGTSDIITYIDSIYLINLADLAFVTDVNPVTSSIKAVRVYPIPADNHLNVVLTTANARVTIYNSVGKKMEEVYVQGTQHTFNVSTYAKGLYFVKANDTVVKFLK